MYFPHRDVSRLIFGYQVDLFSFGNLCSATDHYPMLGTMVMHLHRQLGSRFYCYAFNLVSVACINGVVDSPRAIDFTVNQVLMPTVSFYLVNQLFYILYRIAVGYQDGILSFYNDKIVYSDCRDKAAFGTQVVVS